MFLVCGENAFQIGRYSNNIDCFKRKCINPACDFQIDPSSISSISFYSFHTIWVTKNGRAYAVGSNEYNQITESFLNDKLQTPREIIIQNTKGDSFKFISAVCGTYFTLYLISNQDNKSKLQIAYIHKKSPKITILNINGPDPISLFGGYETAAAIDTQGSILIITERILKSPMNEIKASSLPGNEKAIKVACCESFYVALSSTGKVYIAYLHDDIHLNFTEVEELRGIQISDISGSNVHCLAVSEKGQIFGYGSNEFGQIGIGQKIKKLENFTEIKSINHYNFVAVYAGGKHSLFQTSKGEIFVCGTNRCGQLPINKKITEEIIYTPIKAISGGVTFCIAGGPITGIFIGIQPPSNIPNKRINFDQKKEETIESLKHEIQNLKKKIASLQPQPNIQILDSEMIHSLRIIREISSGASAKVYEVGKEETFALKVMHNKEINIKDLKNFMKEYEIINMLNHPNIIKAFGILLSDEKMPPSILLEYCPNDLRFFITKTSPSNVEIIKIIYQIAEGMNYVHKHKLIHRDLKPSNILIDKHGIIKISDFGISKLMSSEEQTTSSGAGTQKFMAPELLNELEYNEKVDVYSFGVIVYFILSGGEMPKITIIQVGTGKKASIPSSFTQFAKEIINCCWNFDPNDRPSFERILELFEINKYKLIDLTDSEIWEIQEFIKQHKGKIPVQ